MLPLIPLALSFVPELIRLIAGDKAGTVATSVANVVSQVTGTTDPREAEARLSQDPAIAANLRIRLAEIALQAQTAQQADAENQRQAELENIRLSVQNTQGARSMLAELVHDDTWVSAAPIVVSVVVTVGFFAFLVILLLNGLKSVDNVGAQIINIAVGALTAGFATVLNFWLGSSQGSRSKDVAAKELQFEQVSRNREAIESLKEVTKTVVASSAPRPPLPPLSPEPPPQPTPPPDTASAARPVTPAPPYLLVEIIPGLVASHRLFPDAVSWQLSPDGISVEGAPARGTAGDPVTVTNIANRYGDLCCAAAKRYGVPVELIIATIATESGGNPNARRPEPKIRDESVGLMQTLVGTAREALGRPYIRGDDLLDPALSIDAGTAYIAQQRTATHFDPPLVAAAYNAGSLRHDPAEANRWRLVCYPAGTGRHIDNFLGWFADCMLVSKQAQWGQQQGVPSFVAWAP